MAEYDAIADAYAESKEKRLARRYIYDPSLIEQVGDVQGKSVMDLACGDGIFGRRFKALGAAKVVGVDASEEMIGLARNHDDAIEYRQGVVGHLGIIGKFDIAIGGFLLHYAKTKKELLAMCKDVYKNLTKGGRFVALNNNPFSPTTDQKQYGSTVEFAGTQEEGAKIIVRIWIDDQEQCSFDSYYWSQNTYEQCLLDAGFRTVKWIPVHVNSEGVEKFGQAFWKGFYENPTIILIEAQK